MAPPDDDDAPLDPAALAEGQRFYERTMRERDGPNWRYFQLWCDLAEACDWLAEAARRVLEADPDAYEPTPHAEGGSPAFTWGGDMAEEARAARWAAERVYFSLDGAAPWQVRRELDERGVPSWHHAGGRAAP
jgi:hypothetical protein